MAAWDVSDLPTRRERHFGDRVMTCRADRPASNYAMFEEAVARAPEGEAVVCGEVRLTWRQLDSLVAQVSASLAERGIARGDRVATVIGNRAEFVVLLYAINRLGAIMVPISTREQGPGIAYIVAHSGAKLLIHEAVHAGRLPSQSEIEDTAILALDEPSADGELLSSLRGKAIQPPAQRDEEDVFLILYTSGTTGRPKGATIAEINLVHAVMAYEHVFELGEGERTIVAVPMTHVTGITAAVLLMTRCAGTLVIMPEFKAPDFLELASRERMTISVLVPAMYALCLARADFAQYDLSTWRNGGFGGAPMPAPVIEQLHERLPQLRLLNMYGSTETCSAQAIMPPQYTYDHRLDVGLPAPGAEIVVMDEQGRECAPETPGELWLRSATVVPGYWNDENATRENIVAGFWRSGDLGWVDADGFVRVLDRIKDMINRGGYKIYTAEVESTITSHPAVLECAVVAKPCEVLGERVHAFVSVGEAEVDEDDLKAFCDTRLADYKRPESYTIQADPLPRNANGKLLKREMRDAVRS